MLSASKLSEEQFQMKNIFSAEGFGLDQTALRKSWRWLIAIGVGLVLCGIIALLSVVEATAVTVLWVGVMMVAAGIIEIVHSFKIRGWGRSVFMAVIGSLYVFAGFFTIVNPLHSSLVLTLVLGVVLVAAGVVRIVVGFQVKGGDQSGWIIVSGLFTSLLGLIILVHWPFSSLYALGIILGVNLLQIGLGWINLGFQLKRKGEAA